MPPTRSSKPWLILGLAILLLAAFGIGVALLIQQAGGSDTRSANSRERIEDQPRVTEKADTSPQADPVKVRIPVVPPPRSSRTLQVFDYGWFTVGYDNERRAGAWGRYELDGAIAFKSSQPPRPTFRTEVKSSAKVSSKDYTNPGDVFERGHIVPSYAMWSRFGDDARKATFVMTNVFPQDGDLNGRIWEDIEDDIAGQTKSGTVVDEGYAGRLRHITVIAGPIYGNSASRLPTGIPIPDACFQVIYDFDEVENRLRARAYLVENKPGLPGPPSRYTKTIREIEAVTGLDFMPDGGADAEHLDLAPAVAERW